MTRLYAMQNGAAAPAPPEARARSKLDIVKVKAAAAFLSSPANMQQVAFGTMDIRLSDGTSVEVPATMRTVCREQLYRQYVQGQRRLGANEDGGVWFGEKGAAGSYRYEGLGRTKFLELAELSAKGDLKQLGALDPVAEKSGRETFVRLTEYCNEIAQLWRRRR